MICPDCGAVLIKRNGFLVCSNPSCDFVMERPIEEVADDESIF